MEKLKQAALNAIEQTSEIFFELSDAIWDVPETAFQETTAVDLQSKILEKLGFQVEKNLAGIPTAFLGKWGNGKPVIGILGEFDALAGMSQNACVAVKDPIVVGGNGHGCGHNLLGAGSIAAAYGIKEYLQSAGQSGTVVYFGCPGEEGGSGKAFMARDGVFGGVDVALSWHPMDYNCAWYESTLANIQVKYKFKGVSSHAAVSPHLGRSALDAVELMNVGVQFLREHVISDARIHYAITNSGGFSPNVVQPEAEVLYLIRAPKISDVQDILERVNNIARGAALMTDTKIEIEFIKACSNFIMNNVIADCIHENLEVIGCPEYTQEEIIFAKKIRNSLDRQINPMDILVTKMRTEEANWVREQEIDPVANFVVPRISLENGVTGSSDVGDVSWVCPTGQAVTAAWPTGTPAHSWQAVSVGKSSMAHKALLYAAKVIAGTAIDLLNDPEKINKAREEHYKRLGGKTFVSLIPKDVSPIVIRGKN